MRKHYDVGVVGCWWGANYGSCLNGYAVYKTLNDMGLSVLMIHKHNAKPDDWEIFNTHNERFIHKFYDKEDISPIVSFEALKELNGYCDIFLTGSDQIWNYGINKIFNMAFLLNFVDDSKKKISFGTSFGHAKDTTPPGVLPESIRLMHRFDAISVREQSGVDICCNVYGVKADVVIEPVFVLRQKEYIKLAKHSAINENTPYILTYILDPTPEKRDAIMFYAQISGMRAINVLDGDPRVYERNKEALNLPDTMGKIGAEDLIKLYQGCAMVISDSFHGTAFSIIFNKPFLSITNLRRGAMRFGELLGKFDLLSRLAEDPKKIPHDEKFLQPIDYTRVNEIIERERENAISWLKNAVKVPKGEMPSVALPQSITNSLDKTLCTGCGACVSVCPYNALTLQPDELGYYRSTVDYDKCVGCGKCIKVCPAVSLPENTNSIKPDLFEFIAADEKVLFDSSSGGAFPMLAAEAFQRDGVVAGAAWRDDFSVEHIIIDSEDDLHKLQKSKYLQSYLGATFRQIKEELDNDIFVLFTGCPCQVAGLKAYLGKEYDNLIKVDLLCGNAPSAMFFRKYLEEKYPEGLIKYEFRHKVQGWNSDCFTTTITTGVTEVRRGARQDNYQRVYHNHTMCAPHCENCKYQSVPRFGDLTIGDFWGIGNKDKSVDARNGISAVLCNNEKGRKFFDSISIRKISVKKEVPLDWLGGNGYAINGSHNYCSPHRDEFYNAIKTMTFSNAVNYALKPDHGVYPEQGFFSYSAPRVHFNFDPAVWNENYINGVTILSTRMLRPKTGQYCTLPLPKPLKVNRKYLFKMKFKIGTDSPDMNFHVKDAGSRIFQIIYSYKPSPDDRNNWVHIEKEFVPDCDFYDEFMIGAAQIRGEGRFIAIESISIDEI